MLASKLLKRIPFEIQYIIILFTISRIALTIIGVGSREALQPVFPDWYEWNYSKYTWLDIWGKWDTEWYLGIAKNGYSTSLDSSLPKKACCDQSSYGFFPLYPLLIRVLGTIIQDHYLSGIIISNVSLIIASIFLYRLVELDSNKAVARNTIKYLFIFPTSFILSGVFSESLFLALAISSFYFAKKSNWLGASISGFLLSLSKPVGVLILFPLLYEYLKQKKFLLIKIKLDLALLLLIPSGLFLFLIFSYLTAGDFLAYFHIKQESWGTSLSNPITTLLVYLFSNSIFTAIIGFFALSGIVLLFVSFKKIDFSYWLLGFLFLITPLASGIVTTSSMPKAFTYSLSLLPYTF